MKKILTVFVLMLTLVLASCGTTQDNSLRKDNPSSEMSELLGLDSVKSGSNITEVDVVSKDYYNIKLAEDKKSSLFVYNCLIDSILEESEERLRFLTVNPLIFTADFTVDETTKIAGNLYSVVNKEYLGVGFDINVSSSWGTTIDAKDVMQAYVDGQRDNCISIVYLPAYVEHYQNNQMVLSAYVIMPVYYEMTTFKDNKIQSETFNGYTIKDVKFAEGSTLLASA